MKVYDIIEEAAPATEDERRYKFIDTTMAFAAKKNKYNYNEELPAVYMKRYNLASEKEALKDILRVTKKVVGSVEFNLSYDKNISATDMLSQKMDDLITSFHG